MPDRVEPEGGQWMPVQVASAALVSCPVCASVVADVSDEVDRHDRWHAVLRRLYTP